MFKIFTEFASWITYGLLNLTPETRLGESVHFFIEDVAKIYFLLFSMVFIVSYFRASFSPEKIRDYIAGKPRWLTYLMAVALGAVTPFCSCSSIALFIGFVEAGIPFGVTMAFLTASPMINEVAVAVLASVVGWKITILYVITGLAIGVIGGMLADRFNLSGYIQEDVKARQEKDCCQSESQPEPEKSCCNKGPSTSQRVEYAWFYVKDIFSRTWHFILLGIGVGAAIHGYVPTEFFAKYAAADNPLAVPVAVLMGIPLYSSATGVIPIAEALLDKQVPIGTVLAMMMSVAAISLPEMVILSKVLRIRMLVIFASFLAVAFIVVGYLFNALM